METIAYTVSGTTTEISFKDLGVGARPTLQLGTHGESKFMLPLPGIPPETALAIPFEAACVIYTGRTGSGGSWSGGSILFQGRRTDSGGSVSGTAVQSELVIEDAWYDLRFLTLQATWKTITGGTYASPTYGTTSWPDCVLFQATPGVTYSPAAVNSHITTGQAIKEILQYAITYGGVNLQIGTLDPDAYVPFYPIRSMRCADAIKVALRVHPDCACEIDYTSTPPTFNVRKRANLTAITLPYKGSASNRTHLTSDVKPRPDLVPTRVGIYIKDMATLAGQSVVSVSTDIYPVGVGSGLRAFDVSLDIQGPKTAVTTAKLTTAAFDPTDLTWWSKKLPSLKSVADGGQVPNTGATGALALMDSTINGGGGHLKGIQVLDASGATINLTTYAFELLAGNVCDWMTNSGSAVNVVEATVTAFFTYDKITTLGGATVTDKITEHSHSVRVKLTNFAGTTYTLTQLLSSGETYPTGLATKIYNSLATLQYDFTHTIIEKPFATLVKPGLNALNLSGGASAWTSMAAMVQAVTVHFMFSPGGSITSAETTVRCGPVQHLEAGELVQLFNLFCNRDFSRINPNERSSGASIGGGGGALGSDGPKENSNPAPPVPQVTNVVYVYSSAVAGHINHDAKEIADILAATTPTPVAGSDATAIKTMQPREVKMCDDAGNQFYAIVHCTGGYTKP